DSEIPTEADEDRELNLQSLIQIVNSNDILEIWKISRYGHPKCYQHVILLNNGEHLCTCFMLITHGIICRHFFKAFVESSNACFHLSLIPSRWYKDEYINSSEFYSNEIITSNCDFSNDSTNSMNSTQVQSFTQKYTVNGVLSEKNSKKISQDRLKFGTLMGEAKKAIQFAIQDNDDELIRFIKEYNHKKEAQRVEAESIKNQETLVKRKMLLNDNQIIQDANGKLLNYEQVLDPLKHQSKGRRPTKRLKPSIEFENKINPKGKNEDGQLTSDGSRKCGLCGGNGHYLQNLKERVELYKAQKINICRFLNQDNVLYAYEEKARKINNEFLTNEVDCLNKALHKKDVTIQLLQEKVATLQLRLDKLYEHTNDFEMVNERILRLCESVLEVHVKALGLQNCGQKIHPETHHIQHRINRVCLLSLSYLHDFVDYALIWLSLYLKDQMDIQTPECKPIEYLKPGGVITYDLLESVSRSGKNRAKNQPVYLRVRNETIPESRFCQAGVHEVVYDETNPGEKHLQINLQNC
ncbi:3229_t:CDS:2, partial [Gigaspora margarita]